MDFGSERPRRGQPSEQGTEEAEVTPEYCMAHVEGAWVGLLYCTQPPASHSAMSMGHGWHGGPGAVCGWAGTVPQLENHQRG